MRTNNFHILFALSFTVFINTFGHAQDLPNSSKPINPKSERDSLVVSSDSLLAKPINITENDSITSDSIPKRKEYLSDIVHYKATDYVSMNQKEQKIYLYNEAEVHYQDMDITSGIIVIDYSKNLIYAGRLKDSLGNYMQAPVFTQGENVVEPDSIIFNTETKKALIFNSKTEQNGMNFIVEKTKKENDSVYFMDRAKATTSENLDDPEYYFLIRHGKFVPGKKIITGVTNLFIYDVPTPIGLPFAYFPLSEKQTSGIIFPSFGQENNRGYFIQNGGYYFAISDFVDLAVLGDYYTNGSYGLRTESQYAWRYRFRGNVSFRLENLINEERGFPNYSKTTTYNIRWSHNQDTKSNPSSRFSASVNLGSSRYYQESINQINTSNVLNNNLSSSISYSKTFQGEPQVNYSVTATHSQNSRTESITMTLPTIQGSVGRVFPFAPKVGTKKGILQNVNLQYNVRAENRINTTDSLFFKKEMFDNAKMGVKHTIPLSTNFKLFRYFSLTAGTTFDENWTFNTVRKYYDTNENQVITEDLNGFDSFRTYNFNIQLGTSVYGLFNFKNAKNNPKIQAIRHVMRPSISYNINPAFDQYYDSFEVVTADGTTQEEITRQEYTRFEGSVFGVPNNRFSSNIGIGLSNNIEAKIRPKDSTETEAKKLKIFDNLNFQTAYNLAGDSLQWSPLRVSGGTQLFNSKMSINFGASLDPYALDNNNRRVDKFNIDNGGSLFRLTSANMNIGYTLSSSSFDKSDLKTSERALDESVRSGGRDDDLFGKPQDFTDQRLNEDDDEKKEPSAMYNYKIPWSLRLQYTVNYNNSARQDEISSHSLMFSGDMEIAPRWTVGASSGYDFKNQGFTYTQLRFGRDLLSWRMDFSWIPFSQYSSWNFFIGIKSNLLKDLKYDARKRPDQQL